MSSVLQNNSYVLCVVQESWLYHLTVASGASAACDVGTEFEQLLARLMTAADDVTASCYWAQPQLLHSKEPLATALTSLPSSRLREEAVELFTVSAGRAACGRTHCIHACF